MKDFISFVIPVFNEENSIEELYDEISSAMEDLAYNYEIIFIDDGSYDSTQDILQNMLDDGEKRPKLKSLRFEHNSGKAMCLKAGFAEAKADIIVTMDGDLQDDPHELKKLLDKIEEGYDCVSGWKYKRDDPLSKVLASRIFNLGISLATGLKYHDLNSGFKVYRKEALKGLDIYGNLYRFIPVFLFYRGFRTAEVKVNHRPRKYGSSKYGFRRLFQGVFDLLTVVFLVKFARKPLYFFAYPGLLAITLGCLTIFFLYMRKFLFYIPIVNNQFLFLIGLLSVIVGFQFFGIGLLAELINRNISRNELIKVTRTPPSK